MDRISVTLPSEMVSRLSDVVDESYDNRSEAVRDLLEKGFEHEQRITDLEEEYEAHITELKEQVNNLERETERLQNEKRLILEQREEHTELVEYVEEERDSNRRDRERRQAPAWRRAKWWLLGEPDPEAAAGNE